MNNFFKDRFLQFHFDRFMAVFTVIVDVGISLMKFIAKDHSRHFYEEGCTSCVKNIRTLGHRWTGPISKLLKLIEYSGTRDGSDFCDRTLAVKSRKNA